MPSNLIVDSEKANELINANQGCESHNLTQDQLYDLELFLHGNYFPLTGYINHKDFISVQENYCLDDGSPCSKLFALAVDTKLQKKINIGNKVELRDSEGVLMAFLTVESIFSFNQKHYFGGLIEGIETPYHINYQSLRLYQNHNFQGVITMFICNDLIHKSEINYLRDFFEKTQKKILIQTFFSDPQESSRHLKCIKAALSKLPENSYQLSILPGVPPNDKRTFLNQEIIANNWGIKTLITTQCTKLISQHSSLELINIPKGSKENSFEEVLNELTYLDPPNYKKGITIFFTGLSGSGKSTIAKQLQSTLLDSTRRNVTLLDGDVIRKTLCSGLGFSKEDRLMNLRRISFVSKEICKNGGIVICAPIAPYDEIRKEIRANIEKNSIFILVYVNTSLEECEKRDRKGLYAKARNGEIKEFTGISDPYEIPKDAEIELNTEGRTAESCCEDVIFYLKKSGLY
jgi:sulfate adenylyltransferase